MRKQFVFRPERGKDRYRREIEDRLKNRPTFDPVTGHMIFQNELLRQR